MAKVSLADIAKKTGYSVATVSNALNHKRSVGEETAEKIREVAADMGYLRRNAPDRIRLIFARKKAITFDSTAHHPYVIEGVEDAARSHGMQTVVSYLDILGDDDDLARAQELMSDPAEGCILLGTELGRADIARIHPALSRVVLLDCWINNADFDAVTIDNQSSAYHAVAHLIERGHKNIGYLHGNFRLHNFQEREQGFDLALSDNGIDPASAIRVAVGETPESAYRMMREWLAAKPELPTAFFADNDIIAANAMRALAEAGVSVPEDVSLVGFDDVIFAENANPPLTTMRTMRHEMGELAVKLLLEKLARGDAEYPTLRYQVSTKLIERQSVKTLA
jgi:LacI family transcriptional regulator, purine nucleotide synthesis repressor